MSQSDLAQALGISQPMVSRLVRRGMPEDVDGARRWRTQHLNIAQRKRPIHTTPPQAPALDAAAALALARDLAETASELLALGRVAEVESKLRAALRAVPLPCRPALAATLPSDVLAYLTRDLAAWFAREFPAQPARLAFGRQCAEASAADHHDAESLAYAVAAGEVDVWAE